MGPIEMEKEKDTTSFIHGSVVRRILRTRVDTFRQGRYVTRDGLKIKE